MAAFYAHMLNQTVDLEPFGGLDSDGSESFGTIDQGVPAYVDESGAVVAAAIGSEDDEKTHVLLAQAADESDRLHLPGGEVMKVMEAGEMPSTDGRVSLYWAKG